jgi:phosphoribosylformylglycinamidine synthase
VQGNTIVKPLVGSGGRGPGDASVLEPVAGTNRGIALACGLQTPLGDAQLGGDPYVMTLAAIDECVRNLVCVGADPSRIAILDNFCWPSCQDPANLGSLVRAAEGCYDGAMAYRTPFVSGKDSLNNQFKYDDNGTQRVIQIPPTLLITGMAIVPDVRRCITMDAKRAGNVIMLVGATEARLGASLALTMGLIADADVCELPGVDLKRGPATAKAIAQLIRDGLICSAHDCSEGGWLVALGEMLIATTGAANASYAMDARGPLGATISLDTGPLDHEVHAFSETPSRYLIEVAPADVAKVRTVLNDFGERVGGIVAQPVAHLTDTGELVWSEADMRERVDELARVWLSPLDW